MSKKIDHILEALDIYFRSNRFMNGFLGAITFIVGNVFWVVSSKDIPLNFFWVFDQNNLELLDQFGDSFVPSVITYCIGILLQNIILYSEKKLKYYSGIIIVATFIVLQFVLYILCQKMNNFALFFFSYWFFPVFFMIVSVISCPGKENNNSLSG